MGSSCSSYIGRLVATVAAAAVVAALGLVDQGRLEVSQISLGENVGLDLLLLLSLVLEGDHLIGGPQIVPTAAVELGHFLQAATAAAGELLGLAGLSAKGEDSGGGGSP